MLTASADTTGISDLASALLKIRQATGSGEAGSATVPKPRDLFVPKEPRTLEETGLTPEEVEKLVCKLMFARGAMTGRKIAEHVGLPFGLMDSMFRTLKNDLVLAYKNTAAVGDYEYMLTELGRERARRYSDECTYFGAAPVPLKDYIASVAAQSIAKQQVGEAELRDAFSDLLVSSEILRRLGPAINSGRGMFLYGSPGNGKSSIAERITRCFRSDIWIPRAIGIDGQIIRLYDPVNHEEMPEESSSCLLGDYRDRRWVRIRRPTIVVGGELTLAELEVQTNRVTKVGEAPLQLKSNCGTLVIDDFGRQRMPTFELLNRWIVPLERRFDFLNLSNGKKIQVPFDQLLIFSTNLEPKALVDEAFLRRIPYKIHVTDPSLEHFRQLFHIVAPKLGFEIQPRMIDYLIERHYHRVGRPLRSCQPRDLLLQVRNWCLYQHQPLEITEESLDLAVENYFTVL